MTLKLIYFLSIIFIKNKHINKNYSLVTYSLFFSANMHVFGIQLEIEDIEFLLLKKTEGIGSILYHAASLKGQDLIADKL